MSLKDDDIIRLIENFKFDAGPVAVERRNRLLTHSYGDPRAPSLRCRLSGRAVPAAFLIWDSRENTRFPFPPFGTHGPPSHRRREFYRGRGSSGPASKTPAKIRKVELRISKAKSR